jgi:hypothetical protein
MKEYYLKLPKEKADKEKQTGLSELERSCRSCSYWSAHRSSKD